MSATEALIIQGNSFRTIASYCLVGMLDGSASVQDWTHLEAIAHPGPTTKGLSPMLVTEMIDSSFGSALEHIEDAEPATAGHIGLKVLQAPLMRVRRQTRSCFYPQERL